MEDSLANFTPSPLLSQPYLSRFGAEIVSISLEDFHSETILTFTDEVNRIQLYFKYTTAIDMDQLICSASVI